VSAISCLVGAPAWQAAWRSLGMLDGIDVGLHLDLTEFPLIAASRRSLAALIVGAYSARLDQRLLRAEIAAQLDAFERALGRPPDFVDGHRHVHQLPGVRDILLELLAQRGGTPRPWLRSTSCDAAIRGFKPWAIEALGAAALGRLARRHGLAQNRHLLGVYDFAGGAARYRALLRGWLAQAHDGDLLMCHPSVTLQTGDPILSARGAEYESLAAADWADTLAQAQIALRPMSRILDLP
jgi:chitin disaccharide deacetylase